MVAALRPGPRLPPVVTNCLLPLEMAQGIRGRGLFGDSSWDARVPIVIVR